MTFYNNLNTQKQYDKQYFKKNQMIYIRKLYKIEVI